MSLPTTEDLLESVRPHFESRAGDGSGFATAAVTFGGVYEDKGLQTPRAGPLTVTCGVGGVEGEGEETIDTALTASETGHLVFATLHTNSAAESINRMIDAFPAHQQAQVRAQLAFVLEGVITQTLLPKSKGAGRVVATEISQRFRKAVLSEHLLHELRAYWVEYKPKYWLFPGQKIGTHISNVSVSQVLYDAKKKSA